MFISNYRRQVEEARRYNQTPQFEEEMRRRPQVERVIFELTRYNGARRCRLVGLLAADFQAKMSAAMCNLKLWLRKLDRSVKAPAH